MTFFQTILKSFTDKAFYVQSAGDSFGKRFKYLVLLIVLTTLLGSAKMASDAWQWVGQDAPKLVSEVQYEIDNFYPSALEMTLDKGILTTNLSQPLVYTPRAFVPELKKQKNSPQQVLVLDTNAQGEDIETCSCMILITAKGIHVRSSNKVEYRPFSEFSKSSDKPVSIAKKDYDKFVTSFRQYISVNNIRTIVIALILTVIIIGPISVTLGWLLTLLFWSLFGLLAARIIKRTQSYGYIYKMSMYLVTPFILLDLLSGLVGFVGLSGWVTIILYMIAIAVFIPTSIAVQVSTANEMKSA